MCLKVTKPDGSHISEEGARQPWGAASLKAESVNVKKEQGEMKPQASASGLGSTVPADWRRGRGGHS